MAKTLEEEFQEFLQKVKFELDVNKFAEKAFYCGALFALAIQQEEKEPYLKEATARVFKFISEIRSETASSTTPEGGTGGPPQSGEG